MVLLCFSHNTEKVVYFLLLDRKVRKPSREDEEEVKSKSESSNYIHRFTVCSHYIKMKILCCICVVISCIQFLLWLWVVYSLQQTQRIQNSLARAITGTAKYEHIALKTLLWLPIKQRVYLFKDLSPDHKAFHARARLINQPMYLCSAPYSWSKIASTQRGLLMLWLFSHLI